MRPIAVPLGALLLVVAGCSGGDDAPAAATTQVPVTTQPAAESTTPPSSAEAAVDAAVVYEPGSCTYLGPAVIPRGTEVAFEFDDDGSHDSFFAVGLTIDGVTREEIIEYLEISDGSDAGPVVAPYFVAEPAYYREGASLMVVEFLDDGDWHVVCGTSRYSYLGGMIQVIEPAAEFTTSPSSGEAAVDATVVYEPGNCTYLGPAVIPAGTKATFEFDDGGHPVEFIVTRVTEGTTREEIIEYNENPNTDPQKMPYFVEVMAYHQEGAGLLVVEVRDDGYWNVVCRTPPDSTNRLYQGGIIQVIEG